MKIKLKIDAEKVKTFLRQFTMKKGTLEIRLIKGDERRQLFVKNPDDISKVIDFDEFSSWNWYFGVAQRKVGATSGKKEDLLSTLFLWVDIDSQVLSEHEARELCPKSGYPHPSIIVHSGHGTHLYWRLDSPYSLSSDKKRDRFENVLKFMAERLGGDIGAHDATRILRMPGTFNVKKDPVPCTIVYMGKETYGFEQFEENVIRTRAITSFLKQHWTEDRRHNLALAVSACLRRRGYSEGDVKDIVREVCDAAGDKETQNRLDAVKDTYQKPQDKIATRRFLIQAFQNRPNPELSAEKFFIDLGKAIDVNVSVDDMFVSPEIRAKVDAWLEDPTLLFKIKETGLMEKSGDPLINEGDNLLQLILLILAKASVEVGGLTSSGKNELVDHTLKLIPREWWEKFTGITDKALRYLPKSLRILYIAERRGLKTGEESTAEYDMKVSISEGKLKVLATSKDDNGRFESKVKEVEIGQFILTSTDVEAPPELANRLHRLKTRDDPEQNEEVRNRILEDAETLPWNKTEYSEDQTVVQEITAKVDAEAPTDVVIKYAEELKIILDASETRVRRNTKKILQLIKACTRLHYRMRPIVKGPNGERVLLSLPEDFWLVWQIGKNSLVQTLSGLPQQLKEATDLCQVIHFNKEDITSRNLLEKARIQKVYSINAVNTAKNRLDALERRGILAKSYDEAGAVKKGKHGAYIYDYISNNDKSVTYNLDDSDIWCKLSERFKINCDNENLIVVSGEASKKIIHPLTGKQVDPSFLGSIRFSSSKPKTTFSDDKKPKSASSKHYVPDSEETDAEAGGRGNSEAADSAPASKPHKFKPPVCSKCGRVTNGNKVSYEKAGRRICRDCFKEGSKP